MNRNLIAVSLLAVVAIAPLTARASDGTITLNGALSASTCAIAAPSSFIVTLPTLSTASLAGSGSVSGNTLFSLGLSSCTVSITGATMFFEAGANIDTTNGRLNMSSGTATHVQLQFLNSNGSIIDLSKASGSQNATSASISSGAGTLQYTAQYYATGTVTPGSLSSTVTYSIVYN